MGREFGYRIWFSGLMKTPLHRIYGYAIGDGAVSLSMNGISNFALLYYTQVLGLGASYAGLALSLTLIWDAVTDPIMGHVSDSTRSRFGRRHPFLALGGGLLVVSFFFMWFVPEGVAQSSVLFWYLLGINLATRTAITIFMVPFVALGFEVCTDYDERSKLQGARFFVTQVVNFGGGAMAWTLFFADERAADGSRVDGTKVVENYLHMSLWLTGAIAAFVAMVLWFTRSHAVDNRREGSTGQGDLGSLLGNFKEILADRLVLLVVGAKFLVQLGASVISQAQMFTYVEYMQFSHTEKTIAHGSGMLAYAAGAFFHARLVRRFDKKATAFIGLVAGCVGNLALLGLFMGGVVEPGETWTVSVLGAWDLPLALCVMAFFQSVWWGGMGLMAPLMLSMVADISEMNYVKRGKLRDGGYTAVFSLFTKAGMGGAMLLSGWLIGKVGYVSGLVEQAPETLSSLAVITFVSGPVALLLAAPLIGKYPVTRAYMMQVKQSRMDLESAKRAAGVGKG